MISLFWNVMIIAFIFLLYSWISTRRLIQEDPRDVIAAQLWGDYFSTLPKKKRVHILRDAKELEGVEYR